MMLMLEVRNAVGDSQPRRRRLFPHRCTRRDWRMDGNPGAPLPEPPGVSITQRNFPTVASESGTQRHSAALHYFVRKLEASRR
jgi:hypothetical protein